MEVSSSQVFVSGRIRGMNIRATSSARLRQRPWCWVSRMFLRQHKGYYNYRKDMQRRALLWALDMKETLVEVHTLGSTTNDLTDEQETTIEEMDK